MRAILCALTALALLATSVPANAPTPDLQPPPRTITSLGEFTAWIESQGIDLSQAQRKEISVPAGPGFEIVVDHTTGEVLTRAVDALVTPAPDHGVTPADGCVVVGDGLTAFGYLNDPLTIAPLCLPGTHTTPPTQYVLVCVTVFFCVIFTSSFVNLVTVGFHYVACTLPGGVHVGNPVPVGTPTCTIFSGGRPPSEWTSWGGVVTTFGGVAVGLVSH